MSLSWNMNSLKVSEGYMGLSKVACSVCPEVCVLVPTMTPNPISVAFQNVAYLCPGGRPRYPVDTSCTSTTENFTKCQALCRSSNMANSITRTRWDSARSSFSSIPPVNIAVCRTLEGAISLASGRVTVWVPLDCIWPHLGP